MVRTYDFTGHGFTGLFVCHLSKPGVEAVLQANLCNRQIRSISLSVLSGVLFRYSSEVALFINRLNSFLAGSENVVSLQHREDTYHDEDLMF